MSSFVAEGRAIASDSIQQIRCSGEEGKQRVEQKRGEFAAIARVSGLRDNSGLRKHHRQLIAAVAVA